MIKYIYKWFILIIAILLIGYTAKINWGKGQWQNLLKADAKGYYAYLPAVFIYKDLNFKFYEKAEVQNAYDKNLIYDYRYYYQGHVLDKYFAGEAIMLAPFFLAGHFISILLGFPTDGYSKVYILLLTIAAILYLCLGLVFLKKSLKLFNIKDLNIVFVIILTVFGTNLFYYSIGEMGMTHVYSFSLVSVFICQVLQFFRSFENKRIVYAFMTLGLIILVRPVNAIVILSVPFLSNNALSLINGIKICFKRWKTLCTSIVIMLCIVSIQFIIYKIETGSFFVYSYGEEGFTFTRLHMIDFLFSYKKGFFLYTPICLVSLLGFVFLFRNRLILCLSAFLLFMVYVLSSWQNWYYGGSFSSRVMVEYLPFFAILLGLLLGGISKRWMKLLLSGILLMLLLINQIQTLQYRYNIIHWSDMNKERYRKVFLDLHPVMDRRMEIHEITPQTK